MSFRRVLKAADFSDSNAKLCFKKLILQPRPVLQFQQDHSGAVSAAGGGTAATGGTTLPDGITADEQALKCSRQSAASSLFQRFNLQIRHNYGILGGGDPSDAASQLTTSTRLQVLLVVRSIAHGNTAAAAAIAAGSTNSNAVTSTPHITSRIFLNTPELVESITAVINTVRTATLPVDLVVQDLAQLSFEDQIRLVGSSSLIIGMHGAGIATSMHMPVGSKHCCGVIEIFPQGEFRPIRGYGNMARRMGHHYERLELSAANSGGNGGTVPPDELLQLAKSMLKRMEEKPSCVLPSVISDPHFSSIPSVWGL